MSKLQNQYRQNCEISNGDIEAIVPIALFTYIRPDHLQKTLDSLKLNNVSLIYAFCDGPKNQEAEESVGQVRQVLRDINWCEVKMVEREKNLGLGTSIRKGVAQVLEEFDRVIVVEDDIVFRPGAYDYTIAALKQYENDPRVMTVSMWSHPEIIPACGENGFFSERFVCWGWGTYRSEWEKYVGTPLKIYHECHAKGIDVLSWGKDIKWQAKHAEERDLWYVGYALTHFLHNKKSYFPAETLVVNIGHDGSGTNMGSGIIGETSELIEIPVNVPQKWPNVSIISGLEKQFAQYFDPKKKSLVQWVRNACGMLRIKLFT